VYSSAETRRDEGIVAQMEFQIRQASTADAGGIAHVMASTWNDEPVASEAYTAAVIQQSDHQTQVVVHNETVVGFVDGFTTHSRTGIPRWEVDLLAVHPRFRGRGLAARLVTANASGGQGRGANFARALIRVDNVASQRTFRHCGFQLNPDTCSLYVSSEAVDSNAKPSDGLHLIPVKVLNYQGLWLEGELSSDDFVFGQTERTRQNLDLVGAVISQRTEETIQVCVDTGYSLVGRYQWWTKHLAGE
jgi:ribosomal protein S18 acetylase RimI-like enzyme